MKNLIISYALWGKNPIYTLGCIKNCEIAEELFPEWRCRIHVAPTVPDQILSTLRGFSNTEIVLMPVDESWNGMFWRFHPASDPGVDAMISRDCDSLLNIRDRAAVLEWIASDCNFHIMRDNKAHTIQILGGMWGAKAGAVKNIQTLIQQYSKRLQNNRYNIDQEFLAEVLYPLIANTAMVHDSQTRYSRGKDFPIPRKRPLREDIDDKILLYLNATPNSERSPEFIDYDLSYDNDYIGKVISLSDPIFEKYLPLINDAN
jgi:hypothetical protein